MKTTLKIGQTQNEDELENKDDNRNEDDLKNEDKYILQPFNNTR